MARVTLMLELLVLLAVGTACQELLDDCDIDTVEKNETDHEDVETNFTGDHIMVHLSPQPGSSHLLADLKFIIRIEQEESLIVHVINSSYVKCKQEHADDPEPKLLTDSFNVTENSERWWKDVEVRMDKDKKKVVIGGVEVCDMKGEEAKTLKIATAKEGKRLAAFNCGHGCLELNDDNIISQLLLPNQAIYLKAGRQSTVNSTATLDWKTDDDDDDSYNGTMNLTINSTKDWQELKISSYDVDGENMTVTVVHTKDRIYKVFRGDTVNGKGGNEGGDGSNDKKITGQLQVRTSANLVWALGCNPNTATSVETTPATTPALPLGTPTAPQNTPTSTPISTPAASQNTPTSTPISTPTSTPLTDSSTIVWKTLAIVTLVLLLVTLIFVICHCANRMQNGGAKVDTMESGLLPGSKSSLMNSNSESCRPRLPSNATPKGETGTLGVNALKTQSVGLGLSQCPSSQPPMPQCPSPQPPMPQSPSPQPLMPQSPSPQPLMPSYVLPNPLQMALAMNQDNDDESEHDYDYLDLNLLKIQIEKNKAEEEKKRKEQEEGLTRHDSENSMYETFSPPAEDETKNEDKKRNEDNTDDSGSKDKKKEDEEVKVNSDENAQKGDGKRVDDDDADSENEDKESESEAEGEDGVGKSEDAGESEGDGERKKEDGVGESEGDGESEDDGERKKEDDVKEKETEDSKL